MNAYHIPGIMFRIFLYYLNLYNKSMVQKYYFHFINDETSSKMLNDLPKVLQLVRNPARIKSKPGLWTIELFCLPHLRKSLGFPVLMEQFWQQELILVPRLILTAPKKDFIKWFHSLDKESLGNLFTRIKMLLHFEGKVIWVRIFKMPPK